MRQPVKNSEQHMHKSIQDVSCGGPGILSGISFLGTVSFPVKGNPGEVPEVEEVKLKVYDPHNSTRQHSRFKKQGLTSSL